MTAVLLPIFDIYDNEGAPVSGAKLFLYAPGGTTNQTGYNDADLDAGHAHAQPVLSDAAGRFPPIWLENDDEYRVVVKDAANVELMDIDPVNPAGGTIGTADIADSAITAAKLSASAITDKLTYTPVDAAGDTMEGPLVLDTDAIVTAPAGLAGFRLWNLRVANSSDDIELDDIDKGLEKTTTATPTWTIQPQASVTWPTGAIIPIANFGSSGSVTIGRGSGVTLRLAGGVANADRTVAAGGIGYLIRGSTADLWTVWGAGIT